MYAFMKEIMKCRNICLSGVKESQVKTGPDKVMKSIRNIIREKEELHEQKKNARFMYGVSTFYGNCYSCHWN